MRSRGERVWGKDDECGPKQQEGDGDPDLRCVARHELGQGASSGTLFRAGDSLHAHGCCGPPATEGSVAAASLRSTVKAPVEATSRMMSMSSLRV